MKYNIIGETGCKTQYQVSLVDRFCEDDTGINVGMGLANERQRYIVTLSLIGWAHSHNNPCYNVWTALLSLNAHFVTEYRQVSNICRTLVGIKIVDHSDVVGASPVGAAPTTSSFST